ncbi:MAG: hypothetical protein V4664_03995, partial [Patescibacteria group bacterium]
MQYVPYILLALAVYGLFKFVDWCRLDHRPAICVCKQKGFIAVVLRRDYDKASRAHWKKFRKQPRKYNPRDHSANFGQLIRIPKTFVFRTTPGAGYEFDKYEAIVQRCFVERAEFYVPRLEENQRDETAALIHIFKGGVAFNLAGQR